MVIATASVSAKSAMRGPCANRDPGLLETIIVLASCDPPRDLATALDDLDAREAGPG